MSMEELKQEIQTHLEAAYDLLPPVIVPDETRRNILEVKYKQKDWQQLFAFLKSFSRDNQFSEDILLHLKAAEELYDLYDRSGMRTALEHLTAEEKRIIGECLQATAHGPFFLDD